MINVTYVSESRIATDGVAAELRLLVTAASRRNGRDQITGALAFTGTHFVQTLEGTAASVDALMVSIARDPRHTALAVIDRHEVAVPNFPTWSMAYAGPSLFVARTVAQGLTGFDRGVAGDVARLLRLMVEFGAVPPLRAET